MNAGPASTTAPAQPGPNLSGQGTATPLRPRALWIGVVLVGLLGMSQPYIELVLHSFYGGLGSLPAAPVVVLLLLLSAGQLLAKRFRHGLALSRSELLLIYTMLLVVAQLPHGGGLPYILSATVYPFYSATPGNGWSALFHPAIPRFLRLNDEAANQAFYQGLPPGGPIPWI